MKPSPPASAPTAFWPKVHAPMTPEGSPTLPTPGFSGPAAPPLAVDAPSPGEGQGPRRAVTAEAPAPVKVPPARPEPAAPPAPEAPVAAGRAERPIADAPALIPPLSTSTMRPAAREGQRPGSASIDESASTSPAGPPGEPVEATPPVQPPLLFEIAWEVCWQLGGIYTVLRSKAASMLEKWGDRYFLMGPYNPSTAILEFEEQPTYGVIRDTMQRLRDAGIPCYFGRWLIAGRPRVILIDHRARYASLHNDKYLLWQDHGISTPADDGEINDVIAFGFAVAEFFRHFTQVVKDRPVLAHFHEWMGGVAVPRIAHLRLPVSTVFTTHATLLGRYLAGDNPYFYDHLPYVDPDKEAARYMIYPRFAIERAASHAATVFTTVSEVTSYEAEKLLGRKPEVILPNGINIHRFAAPHEFQHLHSTYKERIHEFVMGHFFPSYTFDLDKTIYFFTSGRYEYRNKGMDLYLEAMFRLNQRLKQIPAESRPTIVAFVVTKAMVKNVNVTVLQNQSMFEDLRNTCNQLTQQMGQRLFHAAAGSRLPTYGELLPEDSQVRLKRAMHAWKTHRQPLIVTHDLADDAADPILQHLRHRGLFNAADDPVKMIFHPQFLSATNPVISLDYDQFVRGCHLGIFPSYYEPWGYTPLECVALGLPSVTTDLSGFGAYVEGHVKNTERRRSEDNGILVLHRRNASFDQTVETLVDYLMQFVQLTRRQRIELRNRVERMGERFDWSNLVRHYDEAHNLALERTGARRMGQLEIRFV